VVWRTLRPVLIVRLALALLASSVALDALACLAAPLTPRGVRQHQREADDPPKLPHPSQIQATPHDRSSFAVHAV
jgi:hypothetical protein